MTGNFRPIIMQWKGCVFVLIGQWPRLSCYLKYPDMVKNMSLFLAQDGVHLSTLGNTVFLNTLQGGLEYFASGKGSVYPDSY